MRYKPCPFCGSIYLKGPTIVDGYVSCKDCYACGPEPFVHIPPEAPWELKRKVMINAWNTRALDKTCKICYFWNQKLSMCIRQEGEHYGKKTKPGDTCPEWILKGGD